MTTGQTRRQRRQQQTYSEDDYNSGDGMLTTVWGPSMWHYLHTMSFNYPVHPTCDDKRRYRDFIMSLRHVLPCGKCRKNLCKNMAKLPLTMRRLQNRATFSRYIFDLHEVVNTMLNKKSGLSYSTVRDRYEHFRSRCTTAKSQTRRLRRKEDGCTEPLYDGLKSKCVLHIIPQDEKCETFQMDEKCIKKRVEK